MISLKLILIHISWMCTLKFYFIIIQNIFNFLKFSFLALILTQPSTWLMTLAKIYKYEALPLFAYLTLDTIVFTSDLSAWRSLQCHLRLGPFCPAVKRCLKACNLALILWVCGCLPPHNMGLFVVIGPLFSMDQTISPSLAMIYIHFATPSLPTKQTPLLRQLIV